MFFLFKSRTCTCIWKKWILICNFLVSCDSQVGPVRQTAIFQICSRWYSKEYPKHKLLTALVLLREHKRRYTIKKRKNELKEIIHDRIPCLFRVHPCNFVHFQYIQADNRINTIHWCWCSLHPHDKSGFLYTRQCQWNHRWKNGISELCNNCPV